MRKFLSAAGKLASGAFDLFTANWKPFAYAAAIAAIFYAGVHFEYLREKSSQADKDAAANTAYRADEKRSQKVGLDLNEGNNIYETETKKIVIPAGGAAFDANSVQRSTDRINAGIAARKRAGAVQ